MYYLEPAGNGSNKIVVVRDSDKISEAKNCGKYVQINIKRSRSIQLIQVFFISHVYVCYFQDYEASVSYLSTTSDTQYFPQEWIWILR